jgi:hypothetical protein
MVQEDRMIKISFRLDDLKDEELNNQEKKILKSTNLGKYAVRSADKTFCITDNIICDSDESEVCRGHDDFSDYNDKEHVCNDYCSWNDPKCSLEGYCGMNTHH